MMMPRMGGYPVLEHFRGKTDAPPIIMITANEGSRHKAYAEWLGVVDYIRKPFAMERLLEAVQRGLAAPTAQQPQQGQARAQGRAADEGEEPQPPVARMTPLPEAASVLLPRGPGPPEVFAVRRALSLRFFGGFYASPGGKVSPADTQAPCRPSAGAAVTPAQAA